MQELLYYAQGCTLALTDKVLFSDKIQAWENIPVIQAINTDSIKKYFQENYIKGKTAVDKK